MIIQKRLSYWRVHHKLKNSAFQPLETAVSNTQQVAVLFNANHIDQQKTVLEFEKTLKDEMGYKAYLLGFINRKLNKNISFGFKHVSVSDIDKWWLLSGKTWDLFQQKIYFIVISLNVPQNLMLDWMSFQLKSAHKIGVQPMYPAIYDIVIDPESPGNLEDAIAKSLDIFERIIR